EEVRSRVEAVPADRARVVVERDLQQVARMALGRATGKADQAGEQHDAEQAGEAHGAILAQNPRGGNQARSSGAAASARGAASPSAQRTLPRPAALAAYIARSARRSTASESPSAAVAMPMLAPIRAL